MNMTHKSIPAEKRKAAGVTDSLIRISIGLEDATDLIEDLNQALDLLLQKEAAFIEKQILV
jgi:cystathionine beta-lyase